jgi:DNA adenine methylase
MLSIAGTLAAPFPYFGGKANACGLVWSLFGAVENYVEPFFGSGAMLLGRPNDPNIETINDFDCMVANFWRAIAKDPDAVAFHADWPCNESDLFARHSWLVREKESLGDKLNDPDFYDVKIAGWWCWGACNWIGSGWCAGSGPWIWCDDQQRIVDRRKLPHLSAGRGINRKLPHLGDAGRGAFIAGWFSALHDRLRDVRVCCGDWSRVLKDSVTTRHGLTAVFLDPPYDKGSMDYGAGGMGQGISAAVRKWCVDNGNNEKLRIVICGHSGEHDALLGHGWKIGKWTARKGYALTDEAIDNSASETVWASPHCQQETGKTLDLFSDSLLDAYESTAQQADLLTG